MPPWCLPTAVTRFVGFTYGNASSGEVRGAFISPPGHKVEDRNQATVREATARLCGALISSLEIQLFMYMYVDI